MPFIPHTDEDVAAMLTEIGAAGIDELFDEIPAELRAGALSQVPDGMSELAMMQTLERRAVADAGHICFIGAGCYDHHVPAAVWDIAERGEFLTAYTPYQAEASQGTLQLIYEYQSMMAALTGMDVSNASVYDGGSALAEAVLMAVRANRRSKTRRVLVPASVHPFYRRAAADIVRHQDVTLETVPFDATGIVAADALGDSEPPTALVVQQPNFFGRLEQVDALADWAADRDVMLIAVVNPLSLSLLEPPGAWGGHGADIVCGDGQPLGIPMASGGPSFGFLCCREKLVRQMPGRIIGRTVDLDGKTGFALTLQAREQHIRRAKATSNICTNQGLLVTAATIHMSIMGAEGLARVARACIANTRALVQRLCEVAGVERRFDGPVFHECALRLPKPAAKVAAALAERGVLGGYPVGAHYDAFGDTLLVCATEKRTREEIEAYAAALEAVLA